MSLSFQSICSSSSGNCLTLWSDSTRILIDCGLSSMKRTRRAIDSICDGPAQVDSVLVTHTHSDHISYYPLRVLNDYGLTVHLHDDCVDQLKNKHFNGFGFADLDLCPFKEDAFTIGDFLIKPFRVTHNPVYPTYGYEIYYQDTKVVIATDFSEWDSIFERFLDADFIFVESNHDLELLRQYYNPNSRFHLPNPDTAQLLVNIVDQSRKAPQTVVLGHLSDQRNAPDLALAETTGAFQEADLELAFDLYAAPLKEPSAPIQIHA